MTPEQLRAAAAELLGPRSLGKLAGVLGYQRRIMTAWAGGHRPIPRHVERHIEALLTIKRMRERS